MFQKLLELLSMAVIPLFPTVNAYLTFGLHAFVFVMENPAVTYEYASVIKPNYIVSHYKR